VTTVSTWLVTGAAGQVGSRAVQLLRSRGSQVVGRTRAELDIADANAVEAAIEQHRPDVVINTAAYTAVDAAETDEPAAHRINGGGPGNLASALSRHGGRLIHVSTDYVFDGTATAPYEPDAAVGPRSAYGRTKLAGERAVLAALPGRGDIVRTAWVYGGPGKNFVDTMRRLEHERDTVSVVADQIGSPTWAQDLAAALIELGDAPQTAGGVRHFVNAGQASWFELAREVFRLSGADPERVQPIDTSAYPVPAPRPAWSVLSTESWTGAGLSAPRDWREALAESLAESRT
jgi:dTDP-4-dehydrorhamnose reductase